jgi:hypothetical protein
MAKYCGKIGFASDYVETAPGVYEEQLVERLYYGDLYQNSRNLQHTQQFNDTVNISNRISILSDPYAMENFHKMRYAEFMGTKWRITHVKVVYPRLELDIGGEYHVETQS